MSFYATIRADSNRDSNAERACRRHPGHTSTNRGRRTAADASAGPARIYGSDGLRRLRSVRRSRDRLSRASIASKMAPAHQYQPPSVTARVIIAAASTTSMAASTSCHRRRNTARTL
jgi:hypothetical protein